MKSYSPEIMEPVDAYGKVPWSLTLLVRAPQRREMSPWVLGLSTQEAGGLSDLEEMNAQVFILAGASW